MNTPQFNRRLKAVRPGCWRGSFFEKKPSHWEESGLVVGGGKLVMNLTAQSLKDGFLGRVCVTGDGGQCLLN